jgi:hypothetical protein
MFTGTVPHRTSLLGVTRPWALVNKAERMGQKVPVGYYLYGVKDFYCSHGYVKMGLSHSPKNIVLVTDSFIQYFPVKLFE